MSTLVFDWSIEKARFATSGTSNCFSRVGHFPIDVSFLSSGDTARLNAIFWKAVSQGINDKLDFLSRWLTIQTTVCIICYRREKFTCYHSRKRGHEFQTPIVLQHPSLQKFST
jgi:hypothetical protein